MSSNLQALDNFPSFTGEESPQEQIRQLQNYLFVVAEQLKYTMRNLGVENLNPKQWDSMKEETLKGLIADYIIAGILKSKDEKTFYLDLDKGVLKMQASEFSVSGKTVQEIADASAEGKAKEAVDGMTQDQIFRKLTNDGTIQGLFMKDGQMYVNVEYLAAGIIASADGTVKVDLGNNCVTIDGKRNGYKTQIKLSASGLQGFGENTQGKMEHVLDLLIGVGGAPSGLWNIAWEENTGLSFGTAMGALDIGTTEASTHIIGNEITMSNIWGDGIAVTNAGSFISGEKISIGGKTVSWKDNGDGTYTLIGQ